MELPSTVSAMSVANANGTFTIVINNQLDAWQRQKSFQHEILHIINRDHIKNDVNLIELQMYERMII